MKAPANAQPAPAVAGVLPGVLPGAIALEEHCAVCAERKAWRDKNRFRDKSDALNEYYAANGSPDHSYACSIHQMMSPVLLVENIMVASHAMKSASHAGQTRKTTGLLLFMMMNVALMMTMVLIVLALIPSFRDDDANDKIFFILGGVQLTLGCSWALISGIIDVRNTHQEGIDDDGWEYSAGAAWKILDEKQAVSEISLANGRKIANDRLMRAALTFRLTVHCLFICCKAFQAYLYEEKVKLPAAKTAATVLGFMSMACVLSENIAALQGYVKHTLTYNIGIAFQTWYHGGAEKIPFRPAEKGINRFQGLMMMGLLSPIYLVIIVHLACGVKSTSTWLVPFCGAMWGLFGMVGAGILKA